jgi:hypothetical protein
MNADSTRPDTTDLILPETIEVLGLQFYGRSGTIFIGSLLDSHPQMLTVPGIQNMWLYAFLLEHPDADESLLLELFFDAFSGWFEPDVHLLMTYGLNQLGDRASEFACIPRRVFRMYLEKLLPRLGGGLRRRFFVAVHLAHALTRGQAMQPRMVILFHSHDQPQRYIRPLLQDFPGGLRFLHTVREPVRAIESLVRALLYRRRAADIFPVALGHFLADCSMPVTRYTAGVQPGHAIRPYFSQNRAPSRVLRLEDVHCKPEETLRLLCAWLGIDWDDCLLHSTFNGLPWWSSPESKRLSGFDPAIVSGNRTRFFSPLDIWRLRGLLSVRLALLGYPRQHSLLALLNAVTLPLSVWLPFRHELRIKRFSDDAARRLSVSLSDTTRGSSGYFELRWRLLRGLFRDLRQHDEFVPVLGAVTAPPALGALQGSWRAAQADRDGIKWAWQRNRYLQHLANAVRLGQDSVPGWLAQLFVYAQWYRGKPCSPDSAPEPTVHGLILLSPAGELRDAVLSAIAALGSSCRCVDERIPADQLGRSLANGDYLLIMSLDYAGIVKRMAGMGKSEFLDYMPLCLTTELGRSAARGAAS